MILVDPIREYKTGPRGWRFWCHMATDDPSEQGFAALHAMAARLGIPRRGFQDHPRHPHYDLHPDLRALAVYWGAVEVTSKDLVRRCFLGQQTREGNIKTMTSYICVTCGVQFSQTDSPPSSCPICQDDRQYIGWGGQQWTTLTDLKTNHRNTIEEDEPNLVGITSTPSIAIGQRARLIRSQEGNILWECITLLDDATIEAVRALGGISAIAISHPHFYSTMIEWSQAFNNAPIYIHEDNRPWVMDPHLNIVYWSGEQYQVNSEVTLQRCGGHFPGSSVLHWAKGADGKGALLTGDTIYVVQDRRYVSFMYSYPNLIPLNAKTVQHIVESVEPYRYDRIYSSWKDRVVTSDAKEAVKRSAERYLKAIGD